MVDPSPRNPTPPLPRPPPARTLRTGSGLGPSWQRRLPGPSGTPLRGLVHKALSIVSEGWKNAFPGAGANLILPGPPFVKQGFVRRCGGW